MMEHAVAALRSKCALELKYDDHVRIVEVHAVGWTKSGHGAMRVWQVKGGAGERPGWKLLKFAEAKDVVVRVESANVPRPGYKRSDAALERIICEL